MNATLDQTLLYLNGAVCAVTCISILMYRRDGAPFSRWKSLLAYALVVATGTVAFRTLFGLYREPIDWPEFLMNAVVCVSMVINGGNVSALFAPQRVRRDKRWGRSWI